MPYIGKEPVAGNFVLLDSITTSATATYALTKDSVAYSPESARNMIVSLNGVTQAPETAFTVSGSNITFSSALTSSDVIDYILVLGDVLSVGTPSDGTVGTSQMSYPLGNFSSTGIDDNATSTAITIDSSENVGVGTTSPLNKFVVSEGTGQHGIELAPGTTSYIQAYDRAIADYGDLKIDAQIIQFGTDNGTERMRIDSSGNVGIGTTSPDSKLQITTGTNNIIQHRDATHSTLTNVTSAITFSRTDGIDDLSAIMGWNDGGIALSGREGIAFATGGGVGYSSTVERMRIDSSGNVLVGTTSGMTQGGGGPLQVYSTAGSQLILGKGTGAPSISFGSTTTQYGLIEGINGGGFTFYTGNGTVSNRLVIDSSGNVGIGVGSPYGSNLLNVNGGVAIDGRNATTPGLCEKGDTNTGIFWPTTDTLGISTGGAERVRFDSSGNLLVGATSASAKFQVTHSSASTPVALLQNTNGATSGVGGVQTSLNSTANNTNCFHFKGTTQGVASYFLYGNGTSSFTSDERQKKNIVNTRDGYLDDLKRLRVVDYHWNNQEDTEDKSVGLIAQEVEQVFPHLVIEHEMEGVGPRKNLRGSEFTFVLIKAIQEQQAMIEELKAEVAALKGA